MNDNYYAVILAGGGGTRLWPQSRKKKPKHLLKLIDSGTLLKNTFDNFKQIFPPERIFVITLGDHKDLVKEQLPELPEGNLILEPEAKNTALAMGTAAVYIHKKNPNAVIINEAADHIYQNIKKFQDTVLSSLKVAASGDRIVAIGIRPTFPHTGLGYIRVGDPISELEDKERGNFVFAGKGFKEKPDLATAQSFLATGQYLWNANLYSWSTQTVLKAFEKYSPNIYEGLKKILDAIGTDKEQEVVREVYEQTEGTQIDYAVSEKADNLVVIPGDFGWSDIGDWKIVYDVLPKDNLGNVIVDHNQNHIAIDTRDSLIEASGRLIVTVGVSNLVIIDTSDAILICPKDRTQDVKKAVEALKEQNKEDYL